MTKHILSVWVAIARKSFVIARYTLTDNPSERYYDLRYSNIACSAARARDGWTRAIVEPIYEEKSEVPNALER